MYYYKGNPSKLPYTLALFDFPQNGSHLMIPMGFGHGKHDETLISISVPASKSLSEGTGEGPGVSGSTRAGEAERSVEGRSKRLTESCESPGEASNLSEGITYTLQGCQISAPGSVFGG